MQTVSLLVDHDCPFSRPVAGGANARVTHLCHRGKEAILEVHAGDGAELTKLVSEYARIGGRVLYEEQDRTAALVGFRACACCGSGKVIPSLEGRGYLYLPPSSYSSEGESYQFLVQDGQLDPRLRDRLPPEVEVRRVGTKPLVNLEFEGGFLVPVGVFLRELTDRQRQAIVTAVVRGYYRIPRAVKTEELARSFEVSRPAFEALLRKAENKLVAALFPYLAVQSPAARVPDVPDSMERA